MATRNRPRARPTLWLLLFIGACYAADEESEPSSDSFVQTLNLVTLKKLIMGHDKVILLLHTNGCERAEEFAPRLEEVASKVPSIAYGRATAKVAASLAHGVATGAPALKALFRNAPPNKRVLVYQGPPTVDAVLEWAKAVEKWDGSDTAPDGWFVSKEDFQKPASGAKDEV